MDATAMTPLKSEVFHILLVLVEGPRHGYAIMQEVAEATDGQVKMLPGALYRHLQRMLENGMLKEVDDPETNGGESRRRCYVVTRFGRRVAEAEADRLAGLVRRAADRNLLKERAR